MIIALVAHLGFVLLRSDGIFRFHQSNPAQATFTQVSMLLQQSAMSGKAIRWCMLSTR